MLRVLLLSLLLLSCSKNYPAPTASAGKALTRTETLEAPTNLRCEALTDSSARVAWDAVDGATDYDLSYKKLPSGHWTNEPHRGTRLYNTIYELESGSEYRWAVRAENKNGASAWIYAEDNLIIPEDNSFNIEIIFPSPNHFSVSERQQILDAAKKWEEVIIQDMPRYVVPHHLEYIEPPFPFDKDGTPTTISISEGEVIDDIRIYVLYGETSYSQSWGWSYAAASYYQLNPISELISIGVIYYAPEEDYWSDEFWLELGRRSFLNTAIHEIGHVLGIGQGPNWDKYIEPGLKKYSKLQHTDLSIYGNNFFMGPKAWEALNRQPMIIKNLNWVGNNGNPKAKRQYVPFLLDYFSYTKIERRIIGTYDDPGTMEEIYAWVDLEDWYIGIGNGTPIKYHNYHWGAILGNDYMSESSLIPGQRAVREISEVTLGALEDMGYTVDYTKAPISPLNMIFQPEYVDYLGPRHIEWVACSSNGPEFGLSCSDPKLLKNNADVAGKKVIEIPKSKQHPYLCGIKSPRH